MTVIMWLRVGKRLTSRHLKANNSV